MLTILKQLPYQRHFLILSAIWLVVQSIIFYQFGIVTGYEAKKYIYQADYFLQHGHYETGNYLFYSTEILLIALCKKIQAGYLPLVAIQLLFNAVATFCFYRIVMQFTLRGQVALGFTAALLCMYYYQLYNVHLFTESLYFSFSVIFFYGLMRARKLSVLALLLILSGLAILYFTRPVGLFFIPATFLFLVLKFYPRRAFFVLSTAGVALLLLFYLALNTSLNSGGELDFLLPYLDERIICGVPTIAEPHKINLPVEKDSIEGLFYVITHNWQLFVSLSVKRLLAFFGVVRSYYSTGHNIFIGIYFYTMYLLIISGIRKWHSFQKPQVVFILCLLFFTALTTALSCDEWHNRFIFAILPFLLLLASLHFSKPIPQNKANVEP